MIRLILGRAGSGKTTRIMREIARRAQSGGKSLTLVVPEQYSHSAERQLLKIAGDSLSLHGEVLSFKRLAAHAFEELGTGLPALDSGGALLTLYRALRAVSSRLEIYGEAPRRVQFFSALQNTIAELRNGGVTAKALFDAAGDDSALSKKLRDLGLIMESFDAHLHASGRFDTGSALLRLAELIADSSYARGAVYFDGFNDFTQPEMRVIEALMRRGTELCFSLTAEHLESENDAFRLPCDTANELIMTAHRNLETVEISYTDPNPVRPPELLHMESELFGDQTPFARENAAVEIFAAPDETAECEYAAAIVKRLVRKGVRFRDIAVLSHGNDTYPKLCENIFMRHGIPVFRTGRDDILDKPPIRLIISALDTLSSRWEYEDVFTYLKTGLSGIPAERLDMLEEFVYRRNIHGGAWLSEAPWYGASEEIDAARCEVAAPLHRLSKVLGASGTGGEMLYALYEFLEDISLPDTLNTRAGELRAAGRDRLGDEYLQLWDVITGALDQMYLTVKDLTLDMNEFSHLLKLLFSCYDVGVIPVALDRVTVGGTAMSRRRGVRALIVLGATDGNMPRVPEQSGVLSAAERDKLVKTLNITALDSTEKRLEREFNVIYSALSMPSEYLAVIYGDSHDARPSFITERLGKLFSIAPQRIPASELTLRAELEVMRSAAVPDGRGSLSPRTAEALYGGHLKLSATRVERFNSCKFAFFMQNGLAAKPRERESFDAPEAGTFIHYILERTASEIRSRGGFKSVSGSDVRLLTRRFTGEFISEYYPDFDDRSDRFRYLLRRLSADAERITLDLAGELAKSEFEPLRFEALFDAPLPENGLEVTGVIDRVDSWVNNGKLYVRVSDYKTGRREFSLSDVFYGLGMQMLIYLYALGLEDTAVPAGALYTPSRDELYLAKKNEPDEKIAAELAKKLRRNGLLLADPEVIDAMETGGEKLYLPVKVSGGGYSGDSLVTLEQFGKLSAHVAQKLADIAKEIRAGCVDSDPYYKNDEDFACKYCKFLSACGFGSLSDDEYRKLRTLRGGEFWEALENSLGGEGHD